MSREKKPPGAIVHDTPVPAEPGAGAWGSDPIAAVLRELDIPYIALVPGSSYRGLHDSIVNYLGNRAPQIVLTLHEENTVAIAHGYAKASDRMMAAAVHANIGLMRARDGGLQRVVRPRADPDARRDRPVGRHAAPAVDRLDTHQRRPGRARSATSPSGTTSRARPARRWRRLLRAAQIAQTAPQGPVYVNLDVTMQEEKLGAMPRAAGRRALRRAAARAPGARARWPPPRSCSPARRARSSSPAAARAASRAGTRASRSPRSSNAPVLTNIKLAAAFPTDHRLHAAPPGPSLTPEAASSWSRDADVILSLDWLDLAGTLKQAFGAKPVAAKVINVSCDAHSHRGWSMDHQGLPPVDVYLMCETDAAVPLLLDAVEPAQRPARSSSPRAPLPSAPADADLDARRRARARDPRRAASTSATRAFRSAGTAPTRTSATRSTTSATTAARGVGSGPGHDGRRGARAEGHRAASRSPSWATATS